MTPEEEANIDWNLTTWKGSRLQQHREFLALPFRRKLQINEELVDLAREMQEQRKRQGVPYISIETGERVPGAVVREEPAPSPPGDQPKYPENTSRFRNHEPRFRRFL
jgi:hypothetical protein